MELTQERLKELLHYCPETGVFTRLTRVAQRVHIGDIAGSKTNQGYWSIRIDGKQYQAHRLVWLYVNGNFPKNEIDHINNIRNDNRLFNLREAIHMQNMQNQKTAMKSNKSTGLLGAYFCKKDNLYRSCIRVNKKLNHLGSFKTPQDAHQAYLTAKRQLHEFNTL